MELQLSEDQELFLDTTRKLLAAEVGIPAVRALEHDPAGFRPDYWRRGNEINKTLAARDKALLPAVQGRNHAATPAPALPR